MQQTLEVKIEVDTVALKPLIESIIKQVISTVDDRNILKGKLVVDETEAARLLGLKKHCLRDERLRGGIKASQTVGNRIRYTAADLIGYVLEHRYETK